MVTRFSSGVQIYEQFKQNLVQTKAEFILSSAGFSCTFEASQNGGVSKHFSLGFLGAASF
jgi:hypothetical protein